MPSVRVGLGFIFQTTLFTAMLKFMSIGSCWALVLFVCALRITWLFFENKSSPQTPAGKVCLRLRSYQKTFIYFFLTLNLFFLPLHWTQNYGPFTESGGDVTIYADVAKLIADRGIPVWGLDDVIYKIKKIFKKTEKLENWGDNEESIKAFDAKKTNPPTAEYAPNRIITTERYHSIMFVSVVQWNFLASETNYAVYYGLQAFEYAVTLGCVGAFFSTYGNLFAYLAVFITAGSLGLVSIFYNQYYEQETSILVAALLLPLVTNFPFLSALWWKTVGLCLAFVFIGYLHFINILLPVAVSQATCSDIKNFYFGTIFGSRKKQTSFLQKLKQRPVIALSAAGSSAIVVGFIAIWLATDWIPIFSGILPMLQTALTNLVHQMTGNGANIAPSIRWGEPISVLSRRWFSFYTGFESQQHFPPYISYSSKEAQFIFGSLGPTLACIVAGICIIFSGLEILIQRSRHTTDQAFLTRFKLYVAGIVVLFTHAYLAKGSLYMQAKGAQNSLLYFYILVLLLPVVSIGPGLKRKFSLLILFSLGAVLWVPRLYFMQRIAHSQDRSSTMESSYFEQARKIRKEDPQALVFFEPRNSSDLYLSDQAFFGGKFLATRYLSYNRYNGLRPMDSPMLASDFVDLQDSFHTWIMESHLISKNISQPQYEWVATRFIDLKDPKLLFFADQYEKVPAKENLFWLHHGEAFLFLPKVNAKNIALLSFTLSVPQSKNFDDLITSVDLWLKKQKFKYELKMDKTARTLTLRRPLTEQDSLQIIPVMRIEDEAYLKKNSP